MSTTLISNLRKVQMKDQAGHTKLTAVTIGHGKYFRQFFVYLHHNEKGEAILPHDTLDALLRKSGLKRGDTFTAG